MSASAVDAGAIVAVLANKVAQHKGETPYACNVSLKRDFAKDDAATMALVLKRLESLITREALVPSVNVTDEYAQIVLTRDPDGVFARG